MNPPPPFTSHPTALPGCLELRPRVFADARGTFVKVFHAGAFAAFGLPASFAESFYSTSHRGVLRGLHFQLPPHHHHKLVYCCRGAVLDAAVDLRRDSPAYGRHALVELSAEKGNLLFLPAGLAHGFYALTEEATMVYHQTTVHTPSHDAGLLWSSAGIAWPDPAPLVSARDAAFPALAQFDSPFRMGAP